MKCVWWLLPLWGCWWMLNQHMVLRTVLGAFGTVWWCVRTIVLWPFSELILPLGISLVLTVPWHGACYLKSMDKGLGQLARDDSETAEVAVVFALLAMLTWNSSTGAWLGGIKSFKRDKPGGKRSILGCLETQGCSPGCTGLDGTGIWKLGRLPVLHWKGLTEDGRYVVSFDPQDDNTSPKMRAWAWTAVGL